MSCLKYLLLSLAIFIYLDQTDAVTCDVAPLDANCINCLLYPTNTECLARYLSTSSTTVAPRGRGRRRLRRFFNRLVNRINPKSWF
ncbi:uncharacterized protein LOC111519229 [Drosophila willistoni]|uniref:uncharacterized protein LOC111519229 n=1 Tax=Drosophila willistoni TaxID=7260 RepID=UPI000C26CD7E|nr:uncharacterized protein LOC111519229 [Drosophila willistoni]